MLSALAISFAVLAALASVACIAAGMWLSHQAYLLQMRATRIVLPEDDA